MFHYKAKVLSPIVPVLDMEDSIRFYTEVLGFHTSLRSDDYSILTKDHASLHLARAESPSVLDKTRGQLSIYLEVENVESLWSHVSCFRNRHQVRDLFDRDYGMREFHIIDPNGCLIFVGEPIKTGEQAQESQLK